MRSEHQQQASDAAASTQNPSTQVNIGGAHAPGGNAYHGCTITYQNHNSQSADAESARQGAEEAQTPYPVTATHAVLIVVLIAVGIRFAPQTLRQISERMNGEKKEDAQEKPKPPAPPLTIIATLQTAYLKQSGVDLLVEDRKLPLAELYLDLQMVQVKKVTEGEQPDSSAPTSNAKAYQDLPRSYTRKRDGGFDMSDIVLSDASKKIEYTDIKPSQLFGEFGREQPVKRVWFEGAAGVGKTTFCKYFAYLWANATKTLQDEPDSKAAKNAAWAAQFDIVLYVPLRDLVNRFPGKKNQISKTVDGREEKGHYEVTGILTNPALLDWPEFSLLNYADALDESSKEALFHGIAAHFSKHPERVLFLLDGLDEVALDDAVVDSFLGNDNPGLTYLLTSRPQPALHATERQIKNKGFSPENQIAYVNRYMDLLDEPEETKTRFKQELGEWLDKQETSLASFTRIPLICQLVCIAWSGRSKVADGSQLPQDPTLTALYETLLIQWQVHGLLKSESLRKATGVAAQAKTSHAIKGAIGGYSRDELNQKLCRWFGALEILAFNQLVEHGRVTIPGEAVLAAIKDKMKPEERTQFVEELLAFGILRRQGGSSNEKLLFKDNYEFVHLTFMEYLAAKHFLSLYLSSKESKDFQTAITTIETQFFQPRLVLVWQYVTGLIANLEKDRGELSHFVGYVLKQVDKTLWPGGGMRHLAGCLGEVRALDRLPKGFHEGVLEKLFKLTQVYKGQTDAGKISFTQHIAEEWTLCFRGLPENRAVRYIEKNILPLLKYGSEGGRARAAEAWAAAVSHLTPEQVSTQLTECILPLLKDKDDEARGSAVEAWATAVSHLTPEQVSTQLTECILPLLKDKDDEVRGSAVEAWAAAVPKLTSEQVSAMLTEHILPLMKDKNGLVSFNTEQAWAAAVPKLTPEQVNALLVEHILPLLVDESDGARMGAAEAWGAAVPKLTPEQVRALLVEHILPLLNDEDSWVRGSTTWAWTAAVPKLTPERVSAQLAEHILPLLKDEVKRIRWQAAWAWAAAVPKLTPERMSAQLVDHILLLLNDGDSWVIRGAGWAWAAAVPKLTPEQVRAQLAEHILPLIKDDVYMVRQIASFAWTAAVPKLTPEQVRAQLAEHILPLLKDKVEEVGQSAARAWAAALPKLTPEQVRAQLAEHILPLLKDKNYEVRKSVVEAWEVAVLKLEPEQVSSQLEEHILPLLKDENIWSDSAAYVMLLEFGKLHKPNFH